MPPIATCEELESSFDVISALVDSEMTENFRAMSDTNVIMRESSDAASNLAVHGPLGVYRPPDPTVHVASSNFVAKVEDDNEYLSYFLDDNELDANLDLTNATFDDLGTDCVGQQPTKVEYPNLVPFSIVSNSSRAVFVPGLRSVPEPSLQAAGKGEDKSKSKKNDSWPLRHADQLRSALGWDMRIKFIELPFDQIDELLSNLFNRAVKMNGDDYPSATLKNMLGGFNRLLCRASDVRSVNGDNNNVVGKDFAIQKHTAFVKTKLTIRAAIQKSAREGKNKKTKKVEVLTECMEDAILADVDHQIHQPCGVQKRLVLYLMTRCGIRGGDELWDLMRVDLTIQTDSKGRAYVKFEERQSKNNEYNENRTNEAQFRSTYYSYEPDFIMTAKQYLRHLPPMAEGVKPDLLLQPIQKPASIVWINRVHKVAQDKCAGMMKDMLKLVGLPHTLITMYSNKSGRATLVTRMAARGVPDKTGMLITGHHTTSGYSRYDRMVELKQEAAVLVSATLGLTFEKALKEVSHNFVQEKIIKTWENLNPLMDAETAKKMAEKNRMRELEREKVGKEHITCSGKSDRTGVVQSVQSDGGTSSSVSLTGTSGSKAMEAWHQNYDQINWDEELSRNPMLAKALYGSNQQVSNVANHMAGIYSNCNITIHVVQPAQVMQGESSSAEDKKNKNSNVRT